MWKGESLLSAAHPLCHLETCIDSEKHSLLLYATSKTSHLSEADWIPSFIISQQSVLFMKGMYNSKKKINLVTTSLWKPATIILF